MREARTGGRVAAIVAKRAKISVGKGASDQAVKREVEKAMGVEMRMDLGERR